jgi:hypothetical protein
MIRISLTHILSIGIQYCIEQEGSHDMLHCLIKMAERFHVEYLLPNAYNDTCPVTLSDGIIFALNDSDAEKFLTFYQLMINHLTDIYLTYLHTIPGYKSIPLLFIVMASDNEMIVTECLQKYNQVDIRTLSATETDTEDSLNILQFCIKHGYTTSIIVLLDILYSHQTPGSNSPPPPTVLTTKTSDNTANNNNILFHSTPYNILHIGLIHDQYEACEVLCDHLDVDTLIALFQQSKLQVYLTEKLADIRLLNLLVSKMSSILTLTKIHHSLRLRRRQVQQIVDMLSKVQQEYESHHSDHSHQDTSNSLPSTPSPNNSPVKSLEE